MTTCSKAEWLINHGERAIRPESRSTNLMLITKRAWVQYEPLGVVAAITSWNYRACVFIIIIMRFLTVIQPCTIPGHQLWRLSFRAMGSY